MVAASYFLRGSSVHCLGLGLAHFKSSEVSALPNLTPRGWRQLGQAPDPLKSMTFINPSYHRLTTTGPYSTSLKIQNFRSVSVWISSGDGATHTPTAYSKRIDLAASFLQSPMQDNVAKIANESMRCGRTQPRATVPHSPSVSARAQW